MNYLWSDEKRGFWAAPEVVARDQLRWQGQSVIGASIGAELMRVNHLTGYGYMVGEGETALFCTILVQWGNVCHSPEVTGCGQPNYQ
jgi:hypothetical protein